MPRNEMLPVADLAIDLENFRTTPQDSELDAVKAMIAISPDYFYALIGSLLDDGYISHENILVLQDSLGIFHVKEGNRRIACLKLICGCLSVDELDLPTEVARKVRKVSREWAQEHCGSVPCLVYSEQEIGALNKIVGRIHGKDEKAGRDAWKSVARARHNLIINGAPEPALGLLEKFLDLDGALTQRKKLEWAGTYSITVLDEAMKRTASRFGFASAKDMAEKYPDVPMKEILDRIVLDVGKGDLTYPKMRSGDLFSTYYGLPLKDASNPVTDAGANGEKGKSPGQQSVGQPRQGNAGDSGSSSGTSSVDNGSEAPQKEAAARKKRATEVDDPRTVKAKLRALKVYGENRGKVETIRKELVGMDLTKFPHAFCFLLRSMFELSAKAYCEDHSGEVGAPKTKDRNGKDRNLKDVLDSVYNHLTQGGADIVVVRELHGAKVAIGQADGLLSVTSLNQLVHNPNFSVTADHICVEFVNVFPLLVKMNEK